MNGWGVCALFAIIAAFNAASHGLELVAYLIFGVFIVCVFQALDAKD